MVVLLLSALLLGILPAAASPADDYTNAVHRALTLVQFAQRGDSPSVQQAIDVLVAETGGSQPEVLRDLRRDPPALADAEQRLQALYDALQARVDTPDPLRARQQLRQILSQPRYAGLSAGPSLPEQILGFIIARIADLLSLLGASGLRFEIPIWLWLALAGTAILAIGVLVLRGLLSPGGRDARVMANRRLVEAQRDFFAEADRLAAAKDYAGAIKALTGGVAVRLRGEQAWNRSPLTVRELFAHSQRAESLRGLLLSFEEASYGHRVPDAQTYARAMQSAMPFRGAA